MVIIEALKPWSDHLAVLTFPIMKRLAGALLLISTSAFAATKHAPLPPEAYTAKTIAIVNHAGTQSVTDKAYEELQKWGRWTVLADASKADVVLVIGIQRKITGAVANTYGDSTYVNSNSVVDITAGFYLGQQTEPFFSETERASLFRKSATKRCIDDLRKRMEEAEEQR